MRINRREFFLMSGAAVGLLLLRGQSYAHDMDHTAVMAHSLTPASGWHIGGWQIGNEPGSAGWQIGKSQQPESLYLPLVRG